MADFEKVYNVKFNVATAIKNLKELDKVIDKIEKNKLATKLGQVSMKMKGIRQESSKTGRALDKAFAKNRAKKKIDDIKKSADKAAKSVRSIGNSGAGMKAFSQNMNRYVVLPLAAVGAASIKMSVDLNKSMASVATLLEDPTEKIFELKRGVQDMAVETGQSTTDLSEGLYQVVSALGESSENMEQLGIASKAAVAGVSTTKDAISLLSAVGKGYNDVSSEALQNTSDLAFETVKLGVTTFPELAASMGKVIPLAAQFGTTQEELFATMATLTGVTGNTAEVTTQLSSVYSAFMMPSEAMDNALKKINKQNKNYNFQTAGAMLKTLGFRESINLMNDAADGNEEKLGKIFKRKEAILGVLPLISTQSENYAEKLAKLEATSNSTQEAFDRQTKGINEQGHSFEKTKQRVIVFSQRLGDRLLPVVERLMDAGEPMLEWLEGMDEAAIDNAIAWGKLAVSLALGFKALSAISTISTSVAGGISAIGSAAGGATGQVSGMAGALSKLNGGIAALAVGVAVGGVIWQLIDQAEKKSTRNKNKSVTKARSNVSQITSKTSTVADMDRAIASFEKQYGQDGQNEFGRLSGAENLARQQSRVDRGKGVETVGEDGAEFVEADLRWYANAKKKRANLIENKRLGKDLFLFEGEQRETVAPYNPASDPFGGVSRNSGGNGGGGGQNITITQGNTTIHTGADARSVEAVLDRRDRNTTKDLKRAIADAAGDEN